MYTALTQAEIEVVLGFLDAVERFIDIDFVYDPTGNGEIKVGNQNMTVGGYAFGPSPGSPHAVLLNEDWVLEETGWMKQVLIHEFGHALGLPHSQDSSVPLNPDLDINSATLMASTDIVTNGYQYSLASYMPMDILALQSLYGVSKVVTDDTYVANNTISKIADYGGYDTIDISTNTYDANDVNIVDLARGYVYYDRLNGTWETATYHSGTGWSGMTTRNAENGFYNMIIMPGSTIEKVVGSAVADRITGTATAETLIGLAGNDELKGGDGNDTIDGGDGDDIIDGGLGADTMMGGLFNDTFHVDNTGDIVVENSSEGVDTVIASIDFTLLHYVEILQLAGTALRGTGDDMANTIVGNELDNVLSGGLGKDILTGNAGADTFGFASVEEAGKGKKCDTVTDFATSEDVIDLSAIIAAGDFTFIGRNGFHGDDGELRAFAKNLRGTAKDATYIQGDLDGDGRMDFQIKLTGLHTLDDTDFIL